MIFGVPNRTTSAKIQACEMVTTKNSAKKLDKSRQTKYTNSKFHPRVQGYSKVLKAKSIIEEMILGVLNYQNTFST